MTIPLHRGPGSPLEDRHFDFVYAPVEDDRILVLAVEVTHHKRIEQDLVRANQELTAIHANAPVALFLVDDAPRSNRPGDAIGCLNASVAPDGRGSGATRAKCPVRNQL
jgi:hypothetical protein